jgi:hypothetical protein
MDIEICRNRSIDLLQKIQELDGTMESATKRNFAITRPESLRTTISPFIAGKKRFWKTVAPKCNSHFFFIASVRPSWPLVFNWPKKCAVLDIYVAGFQSIQAYDWPGASLWIAGFADPVIIYVLGDDVISSTRYPTRERICFCVLSMT